MSLYLEVALPEGLLHCCTFAPGDELTLLLRYTTVDSFWSYSGAMLGCLHARRDARGGGLVVLF